MEEQTAVISNEIHPGSMIIWPGMQFPAFRSQIAVKTGVERDILLKTWGGIGDQICAEPTLRYALKHFKHAADSFSLASECPEFFQHLEFKRVFNLKEEHPVWGKYLVFDTIRPPEDLSWQFICHMVVNCVDYPALCAFRSQLPIADREVKLVPNERQISNVTSRLETFEVHSYEKLVAVHPGRHWQSKTFPAEFWDAVIAGLLSHGRTPVIIGGDTDDNRGTVEVDSTGCIDFRNRLSLMETVALLQTVPVLLTNDSAPLHMAVSGKAWIGFVATCKHPDYIMHWRNGQWAWRMKNLGKGGAWEILDHCPNKAENIEIENVGDETLRSWLPEPKEVVDWVLSLETH